MRHFGPAAAGLAALLAGPATAASYDCLIDASMTVELASVAGGLVDEVLVAPGDTVRAGQVVARLDTRAEEATLRIVESRASDESAIVAAEAQLAFLQGRFDRGERLLERGVMSVEEVEQLRYELQAGITQLDRARQERATAALELDRARVALSRAEIVSPIAGLVSTLERDPGEYLHPEDHVVTIVRLDPLRVEAFLPVTDFGSVAEGGAAVIRPAPPVEGTFDAVVSLVERVFDAASSTFMVRFELANPDLSIPAGHRCTVELRIP